MPRRRTRNKQARDDADEDGLYSIPRRPYPSHSLSVPKECRSSSTETLQPSHEVRLHSIARYLQLPEPDRSSLVKAQASNPRTPLGIRYSARSDRLDRDSPQKTRNDRSIDPRHSSRAAPQVGGLKDLLVG
ncbi:hypothetical protein CIRG_04699 [Coccidioides immitis RMSCC 2394]|uniref:Uncharacterized protein n=1 Tax=Coccidioides immitis RMSCC 2394 TaxID=404692 RepID=A0A0J6YDP2_COCIT|nr:hypothetical protein CIRG_04699 [Coccidioides immitis RMSCC 2394]